MQKKRIILLILIAQSLLLPFLLQSKDFFEIRENIITAAWKKVSIFYITPTLTLRDVGYNSNIFSYQQDVKPDWTTDLGLRVKLSLLFGKRFILEIDENPSYFYFAQNVEQRTFNNRLKTSFFTYLGKVNLKYEYENETIRNRPNTEFGAFTRSHIQGHTINIDYGNFNNFFISVYFNSDRIKYEEDNYLGNYDLKKLLNQDKIKVGLQLTKIIFTRTQLYLTFQYFKNKFETQTDRNGAGKKAILGIQFPEISIITGDLQFGIKSYDSSNPLFSNYNKPFGSGKMSIRLFKKFKFHLEYLIDNFYSFWHADQGYNERAIETALEYYLTKNIKLGYKFRTGRLVYEYLTDGIVSRRDNFQLSTISIGFRLSRNFGIGLEYKSFKADSTLLDFSRNTEFIGGFITHEF